MRVTFFRAKKKLAEEKYKRSIAEENEAKALLKYHLLKVELEKLKADVEQSQSRAPAGTHDRYTLLFIQQVSETSNFKTQQTFTCSKSAVETIEKDVKLVQS